MGDPEDDNGVGVVSAIVVGAGLQVGLGDTALIRVLVSLCKSSGWITWTIKRKDSADQRIYSGALQTRSESEEHGTWEASLIFRY